MPQLEPDKALFTAQLFWLAVTFIALYFILAKSVLPKIQAVITNRRKTLSDNLAAAEEARLAATTAEEDLKKQLETAKQEARRLSDEALQKARATIAEKQSAIETKLSEDISAHEKSLNAKRQELVQSVEDISLDAATNILSDVFGLTVSSTDLKSGLKAKAA